MPESGGGTGTALALAQQRRPPLGLRVCECRSRACPLGGACAYDRIVCAAMVDPLMGLQELMEIRGGTRVLQEVRGSEDERVGGSGGSYGTTWMCGCS